MRSIEIKKYPTGSKKNTPLHKIVGAEIRPMQLSPVSKHPRLKLNHRDITPASPHFKITLDTQPPKRKSPPQPLIEKPSTPIPKKEPEEIATEETDTPRWLVFLLRFLAYAIPLGFLAYVLYYNFLPFGYDKTFTLQVGSPNDTSTSQEFYLEPSRDLSDRMTDANGAPYREINGIAYAVFKPKAVLKNATITVSVEGEGVSIIPPIVNFDPKSVTWDYSWDLSKGIPENIVTSIVAASTTATSTLSENESPANASTTETHRIFGNAFLQDGVLQFNGRDIRLELASSSSMFEDGLFTVYAEWTPTDSTGNAQQIVGHYNWELWQNSDSVTFRVGRMNNASGTAYTIKYPIKDTETFFNTEHFATAVYNPSPDGATKGYIELYVDGNFAGRTSIGTDTIWKDYGGDQNLSFGWTPHNYEQSPHFAGSLYLVNFVKKNVIPRQTTADFMTTDGNPLSIAFQSQATTTLNAIHLHVVQK